MQNLTSRFACKNNYFWFWRNECFQNGSRPSQQWQKRHPCCCLYLFYFLSLISTFGLHLMFLSLFQVSYFSLFKCYVLFFFLFSVIIIFFNGSDFNVGKEQITFFFFFHITVIIIIIPFVISNISFFFFISSSYHFIVLYFFLFFHHEIFIIAFVYKKIFNIIFRIVSWSFLKINHNYCVSIALSSLALATKIPWISKISTGTVKSNTASLFITEIIDKIYIY